MSVFRSMLYLFIVCPVILSAQESESASQQETLFSGDIENGGYGCFSMKVSPILNKAQLFLGGYGGWFINHTLMIGGGGYGLTSRISAPDVVEKIDGKTSDLKMGYGGVMVEYTYNSSKLIHFTGNLLLGAGGAVYTWDYQTIDTAYNVSDAQADSFFVGEFGANVELNVSSFARVAVGGSYRFASGLNLEGMSNKDISGPSGNITFKFGTF